MPSPATAAAARAVPLSALNRPCGCTAIVLSPSMKLPRFGSLHETLMREELVRRFGSAVLPDIFRACDELSMDRSDPPCDQVRVAEVTDAYRTIETFADDIDETIAVARLYLKARMSPRDFCKHRRQMRRSQG